ncbi:hypothetical protein ABVV53_01670, partial [Novosphingobium sp. RD2P27]
TSRAFSKNRAQPVTALRSDTSASARFYTASGVIRRKGSVPPWGALEPPSICIGDPMAASRGHQAFRPVDAEGGIDRAGANIDPHTGLASTHLLVERECDGPVTGLRIAQDENGSPGREGFRTGNAVGTRNNLPIAECCADVEKRFALAVANFLGPKRNSLRSDDVDIANHARPQLDPLGYVRIDGRHGDSLWGEAKSDRLIVDGHVNRVAHAHDEIAFRRSRRPCR